MKIRTVLIISAVALLIFTTAVFSVFLGVQLNSTGNTMFDAYLSDVSGMQASNMNGYLSDVQSRYNTTVALPAIQSFTSGKHKEGSSEYNAAKDALEALVTSGAASKAVVYEEGGNILLQVGALDSITTASGICNTEAADGVAVVNTAETESVKSEYTISVKDKVNDCYVGIVYARTGIANIIDRAKGLVFIVDPMGSIVTAQNYVGNMSVTGAQYSPYKDAVANATSTPARFVTADGVTTAYITGTEGGWAVVANQETIRATEYSGRSAGSVTGIAVTMLVIFLAAGIVLIVIITKPFYKIEETLLKISRGDHEARVEIMSRNEYGDIARVFNDIVDNIIVSESRYRTIIEMSDNIIFEWNLQNNEVSFSNNFNKKFSYRAPSDHFADSFLLKCKVHPDDADRYKSDLEKLPKGENFKHNEYRMKNIYGDYIWVLIRTASIVDKNGETVKIVGVIVDIDRAKKSENILTARASFDSLTGVYNRETIESAINNEIELIAARKNEFAILFVDIDDFKLFNDQYSHATGDQVLRFAATTIKNAIGEDGMAGRYGGDEFIVCIKNADVNDPAIIAEQILNTLKEGFESDSGDRLIVNVSIGIAIIKDNTKRVEEIIGMADDAMYKIKKSGKSSFGFLNQ